MSQQLGPNDLVLCPGVLGNPKIGEIIELAHSEGIAGPALWSDYAEIPEVQSGLRESSLSVCLVDGLSGWADGGPISVQDEKTLDVAAAVGSPGVSAIQFAPGPIDISAAADGYAAVCERASERDLWVAMEFLPWSGIPDIATTTQILDQADADNGGLVLDAWHFTRSGSTLEQLETAGPRFLNFQISDTASGTGEDLFEETMHRRMLPGEGTARLIDIIETLDRFGRTYPVTIEVFNDALMEKGLQNATHEMVRSTRI